MIDEMKPIAMDDTLNKLSLVAHTLRFLSRQNAGTDLGALLELLEYRIEECLMTLDRPQGV